MEITIHERGSTLRDRLHDRLQRVARLQCEEHGQPVVAVTIAARENGWFDARWTTCCERLQRQAMMIAGDRC